MEARRAGGSDAGARVIFDIIIDGQPHRLELTRAGDRWLCRMNGREVAVDAAAIRPDVLSLVIDGASYEIKRERVGSELHLWVNRRRFEVEVRDPRSLRARRAAAGFGEGPQKLVAPMPGKVVRVLRAANQPVEAGQGVLVVEAMKMQNELKAPKKGTVRQILAAEGAAVNAGQVLAIVD